MSLRSILLRAYFSQRERAIDTFRRHPVETQARMFRQLLRRGRRTEFGWRYNLGRIRTPEQFASMVETFDYDTFKPYIERMLAGESDVTAPGRVTLFARSSGTTSDRSKYIPVTRESLWWNHTMGMRDVATVFAANNPRSKVFDGKTLTLGGSCRQEGSNLVGDLSALLIHETTFWSGWFRAPKMQTALIADFDRKAEAICRECTGENITAFAGVPSWNLALMRRVLEYTGRSNLLEVWPNLCMFAHGGVEFTPYRRSFEELIPSPEMQYMETYNASEGFFALADDPTRSDMLLMLDYGTYFEFRQGDSIVPLEGVKSGEVYALVITSNNGLWRYEIGDTVEFTSTDPYRIRFAGRTRQYINAFGEEVIADNADRALERACRETGAVVGEYTVAPCYMSLRERGAHEWIVEFDREPDDRARFAEVLDRELRAINSDYDAKRLTTLDLPRITVVERGRFLDWMRRKGKNKVPRLMNDRRVADSVLGGE
ncbi:MULTISPECIES: GH3 auxin-responsive promoter family protein [unclassified Alistipes]|uniref:GH3 auxin-responsive promoter family protein n=1 Tax=unclassified Alistipes TaxID=2608932 RepID=UPI000D0FF59B|nr:GH3 auxin-responsive promoter family protein [Alistipes sp. Marseille-P5061]